MRSFRNAAARLDSVVRGSPAFLLTALAALLISSAITIFGAARASADYYYEHIGWRTAEYKKLDELRAGMNVERFVTELGPAVFVRASPSPVRVGWTPRTHVLVESIFRGRGYWVQAIHDEVGTVWLMAVTSCDESFTPTFQPHSKPPVTLQRTTFAQISPNGNGLRARYFLSAATANSYFYEEAPDINPANYQTFAWGINDACRGWADRIPRDAVVALMDSRLHTETNLTSGVQAFRTTAVVNTYVSTTVMASPDAIWETFPFGVDRRLLGILR